MQSTGIIRRVDDLGRVVIPKEIRRALRIREAEPLEIFIDEKQSSVTFKKYSAIDTISNTASNICQSLHTVTGMPAAVCDADKIIAVAGLKNKTILGLPITEQLLETIKRNDVSLDLDPKNPPCEDYGDGPKVVITATIMDAGDPVGAVILLDAVNTGTQRVEQSKLARAAALFLTKEIQS